MTQGIWGEKHVRVFQQRIEMPGVLSVCLVAAPVVIALIPFWEAGLIPD